MEYPYNNIYDIIFLFIPQIFLEQKWYIPDIFRTWMHFLRVSIMFYDAVSMIDDVITTANLFPYTAKFMLVDVRNNTTQQIRRWKINRIHIQCCCISKISNSVGRNDNFLAKAWKLSILPTSLDIFDIWQHYVRILYLLTSTGDLLRENIILLQYLYYSYIFFFSLITK